MNMPPRTSRWLRLIIAVVLITLYGLGFVMPQPYNLWFFGAGTLLGGLLFTAGGLFSDSPLAGIIGLHNPRVGRSRGFYITIGLIMVTLTIITLTVWGVLSIR